MAINLNEIQIGGGGRYPKKTSLNLCKVESHLKQNIISIIVFALFMVLVLAFVKHFVIAKYAEVDRMEQVYDADEQALEALKEKNSEYSEVRAQYSHYGNGYLNDEEAAEQDRISILNVVEQKLLSAGALENISITGNTATLTVNNRKLGNVSDIAAALEENDIVEYVTVTNSATKDQNTGIVTENSVQAPRDTTVTTVMTIVFKNADADAETDTDADTNADETGGAQ